MQPVFVTGLAVSVNKQNWYVKDKKKKKLISLN